MISQEVTLQLLKQGQEIDPHTLELMVKPWVAAIQQNQNKSLAYLTDFESQSKTPRPLRLEKKTELVEGPNPKLAVHIKVHPTETNKSLQRPSVQPERLKGLAPDATVSPSEHTAELEDSTSSINNLLRKHADLKAKKVELSEWMRANPASIDSTNSESSFSWSELELQNEMLGNQLKQAERSAKERSRFLRSRYAQLSNLLHENRDLESKIEELSALIKAGPPI